MRLLYRILPTNRLLHIKKIKDNAICNLCHTNEQDLMHLFWDCTVVQQFWNYVTNNFLVKLPHTQTFQLSKELIIFGTKKHMVTDKPMDLFILNSKYYIYSCKMADKMPNGAIYLKIFKQRYYLEKYYYAKRNNQFFENLWNPYVATITAL